MSQSNQIPNADARSILFCSLFWYLTCNELQFRAKASYESKLILKILFGIWPWKYYFAQYSHMHFFHDKEENNREKKSFSTNTIVIH